MDYRRRIVEVEIEGLGKVRLKSLSAGFWQRIADINAGSESEGAKRIRVSAESIAYSWVDEDGKPILKSVQEALDDLEIEYFNAIAQGILDQFGQKNKSESDSIKNSESVPTSSLPLTSPES
jgi:hypothetical protein